MITEKEALQKAEAYCSAAERCRSEVEARLARCETGEPLEQSAIERIVTHLQNEGYLCEERYARAFVHDKLHFCKWGRVKIGAALRQKGIPSATIQQALSEIDQEEYLEILEGLIASKRNGVRAASEYERAMKLLRFAAQRGFEPSVAGKIINLSED